MNIILNDTLAKVLNILKQQYGIPQAAVAKALKISVQALTDMKAGRRAVTPAIAEKLLDQYKNEPWSGWLGDALRPILNPFEQLPSFKDAELIIGGVQLPAPSQTRSATPINSLQVPLLQALWAGATTDSHTFEGIFVALPEWAAKLATEGPDPYVLQLAADDYVGRLRAGDHVLIVQTALPHKEIMVVEQAGGLRLARNAARAEFDGAYESGWIALDSGIFLEKATAVATVMGIVMARL